MAAPDNTDHIDILPMLLLGLLIIYLFYLLRPPLLMFWHYGLGMGSSPKEQIVQTTSEARTQRSVATPPPARAPALPSLLQQPVATWSKAPPPDQEMDALDQAIEGLTNQMRQKYGRQNLHSDPQLHAIATLHSWDMLDRGYLDHNSPDGVSPAQRVGKQHRRLFGLTGENVAQLDSAPAQVQPVADRFLEQWMNSPGHRRNILSADYSHMASGCFHTQNATGQKQRRCTQLFARAYAVAEQDIPETVTAGQKIAVRIHALQGFTLPTQMIQLNLSNGAELSAAPLTPSGDVAVGNLTFNGPAGVYSLQVHVPDPDSAGRYWTVPGPYVTVR